MPEPETPPEEPGYHSVGDEAIPPVQPDPVAASSVPVVVCTNCRTPLEAGASTCAACGTPRDGAPDTDPPPDPNAGSGNGSRPVLIGSIVAAVVAAILLGGWFGWQQLASDDADGGAIVAVTTTAPSSETSSESTTTSSSTTPSSTTTIPPTTTAPPSTAPQFGASGTTVGVMESESGVWTLLLVDGADHEFAFGADGDTPIAGDWDCDGIDTPGVWRSSTGEVFLRNTSSAGPTDVAYKYETPDARPLAGDFDGDGCDTVSFYNPADGAVAIFNTAEAAIGPSKSAADANATYVFGDAGDEPFAGDFDGDGADTIGLFRPSTATVYLKNTHTAGPADLDFQFGTDGDLPLAGDWGPADGIDTVAMYTPNTQTFSFRFTNSAGPADETFDFGLRNSMPVAGAFGMVPSN